MRAAVSAFMVLLLGVCILADTTPPTSAHAISPAPNEFGWNSSAVTVTITATDTESGVREIRYILDGGPVRVVPGHRAEVAITAEGVHTLEYWAVDNAGNEETPHRSAKVRIDLTPPLIFIESPSEDATYILHQPVEASWFAFDNLSGILEAKVVEPEDEEELTGEVGTRVFRIEATDRAGNEAERELEYQVVYVVEARGASGGFLDRALPEKERVPLGKLPLWARYLRGEPVVVSFALEDYYGKPYPDEVPTLTVTEVRFEDGREKHVIWSWLAIPFVPEEGAYRLVYPTAERSPGVYDLWISFGDGRHVRVRIEIVPPPEKG